LKRRCRNHFPARSVPSIIGAMQNRCANMLMLFHFIVSFEIVDFWADRNLRLRVEAFSFHFKHLFGRLLSPREHGILLGTALQYQMGPRGTVLVWTLPTNPVPLRPQSNVPPVSRCCNRRLATCHPQYDGPDGPVAASRPVLMLSSISSISGSAVSSASASAHGSAVGNAGW
jgi:hypothetical protein